MGPGSPKAGGCAPPPLLQKPTLEPACPSPVASPAQCAVHWLTGRREETRGKTPPATLWQQIGPRGPQKEGQKAQGRDLD